MLTKLRYTVPWPWKWVVTKFPHYDNVANTTTVLVVPAVWYVLTEEDLDFWLFVGEGFERIVEMLDGCFSGSEERALADNVLDGWIESLGDVLDVDNTVRCVDVSVTVICERKCKRIVRTLYRLQASRSCARAFSSRPAEGRDARQPCRAWLAFRAQLNRKCLPDAQLSPAVRRRTGPG